MKKSIIVMMVAVLLVSALFISCKQEIATPQDRLGTVSIALPSSRALTPEAPERITPDVGELSWFYIATKVSGYYKTGETDWKALGGDMEYGTYVGGNQNVFSAGDWTFSFYGYASAPNGKPSDPKADAVYYAENIPLTVTTENNYIDVVLQGGPETPDATVTFGPLTFLGETLPGSFVVKINGEVATFDSEGKCTFTGVAEGEKTYVVTVWTTAGEQIGEAAPVTINVVKGYAYTITGSIEKDEVQGFVIIGQVGYDKGMSDSVLPNEDGSATLSVDNVAPLAGNDTIASFAAGDLETTSKYVLETAVKGIEDATFVVSEGNVAVASIDLTLYKDGVQTTVDEKTITVMTYIAKGMNPDEVKVVYNNGTGVQPYDINYIPASGLLTFKTTHFSAFNVESNSVAYIPATNTAYESLSAAFEAANGQVVKLLKDVTSQIYVAEDQDVVLDLNGKNVTYSSGYAILNAGKLVIKDSGSTKGTITAKYGIGPCDGSTTIIEYAKVVAQECAVAWVCADASVTINDGDFTAIDNSVLSGNGTTGYDGNTITINGGTFTGGITSAGYIACGIYCPNDDVVVVNGGTFTITNGAGIVSRAGLVTVNGGTTITCTGTVTGWVGDKKSSLPCSVFVFDATLPAYPGYDDADAKIVINDGTFSTDTGVEVITVLPSEQASARIVDNRTTTIIGGGQNAQGGFPNPPTIPMP